VVTSILPNLVHQSERTEILAFESSKQKPQQMSKQSLAQTYDSFLKRAQEEMQTIEREKTSWEEQKKIMQKHTFVEDEIITLNVGGKIFATAVSTLQQPLKIVYEEDEIDAEDAQAAAEAMKPQDHFFSAMFSGNFDLAKDKQGNVFIDRDYRHFAYILNYLRMGGNVKKCQFPFHKPFIIKELINEAEFYNLNHLKRYLLSDGDLSSGVQIPLLQTKEDNKLMQSWLTESLNGKPPKMTLLYTGTRDGFDNSSFHSKCDNKGPTLTVVSAGNIICGGYADVSWDQSNSYKTNANCWLFNMSTKQKGKVTYPVNAIYCYNSNNSHSVAFGSGHDFIVSVQSLRCSTHGYPNIGLPSSATIAEILVYSVQ